MLPCIFCLTFNDLLLRDIIFFSGVFTIYAENSAGTGGLLRNERIGDRSLMALGGGRVYVEA